MPDATWFFVRGLIAASVLFCLTATGLAVWFILRRLNQTRRYFDDRLEELEQHRRLLLDQPARTDARRGVNTPAERDALRANTTLIAVPDMTDSERTFDPEVEAHFHERYREVWELAASGASPEEIARRTGQPVGQVELIMGLYRQVRSLKDQLDHAESL